jgi:hypothetical protein
MLEIRKWSKHNAFLMERTHVLRVSRKCGTLRPIIVQAPARPGDDGRGGVFEEHRAQQAQALQKRRLFDCEQISGYGHERGVLLFVCNWKSVSRRQKSREGRRVAVFPLAHLRSSYTEVYFLACVHTV